MIPVATPVVHPYMYIYNKMRDIIQYKRTMILINTTISNLLYERMLVMLINEVMKKRLRGKSNSSAPNSPKSMKMKQVTTGAIEQMEKEIRDAETGEEEVPECQ